MSKWLSVVAVLWLFAPGMIVAQEYKVEALKDAPPAALSADIIARLSPAGFKVVQGDKRPVCEIWLAKTWAVKAGFEPSDSVLFPLEPGSLVGGLRFARKGADFRGQEIPAGVYTLRYANQPVDGNHVGTFDTRDFLLMLPAAADQSPAPIAEADLFKVSAQTVESTHPAISPLVKPASQKVPELRHLEEQNWWTLRLAGKGADGKNVVLELVVVGKAAE